MSYCPTSCRTCRTSWVIRPSEKTDLGAIAHLFLQGFGRSVVHYVGSQAHGVRQAIQDIFASIWECQDVGMLVADVGGDIAGYIIAVPNMNKLWWQLIAGGHWWKWARGWLRRDYGITPKAVGRLLRNKLGFATAEVLFQQRRPRLRGQIGQILSVAVDSKCRGQGMGAALLVAALAHLAGTATAYVKLEVRPDNHAARRLYHRAGFRIVSTTRDSQGPWLVMIKRLDNAPPN